ncbi:response regulator transcription factor [Botryobacter ruber]|uniref:response regulator transcription factor n=1 Tax=Botryobacter ruber TaxID=2171629 RepID=UPI000E0B9759|nr:response regulator transcription factor [Botryobacter ruber]
MHILIIEDEKRVADLIRRGLEEQDYTTTVAADGEEGRNAALSQQFDLIIMDIILPKLNGLDLCQELRQTFPDVPIIMLTALGTTDDKVEGFDAGANDYLVKPFDFRELHVRIRELLKRSNASGTGSTGSVLKTGRLEMDLQKKIVTSMGKEINLTPKEFALLEYMMRNSGRVVSRVEISENVWNTHFDTGTNFIDVYINYLRKKIDREFPTKMIHTKPGMGFVLKEAAEA